MINKINSILFNLKKYLNHIMYHVQLQNWVIKYIENYNYMYMQ